MRPWLIAIAMLGAAVAHAQPAESDAQVAAQADAAFDQGVQQRALLLQSRRHFAHAADCYLALHRRGVRSPALYLNLGNAAAQADRLPQAIWAYHLGLKLDPNFDDMRAQLALLRGTVIYPPAGQGRLDADAWPPWLPRPTLYDFVCISIMSYVLSCVSGSLGLLRHSRAWTLTAIAFLLAAVSAAAGGWHEASLIEIDRATPLVVIAENTPLYRGNAISYPHHPTVSLLYRGMEVRQLHRRGNWLQVRLTTGEIGWLPQSRVLIAEP